MNEEESRYYLKILETVDIAQQNESLDEILDSRLALRQKKLAAIENDLKLMASIRKSKYGR